MHVAIQEIRRIIYFHVVLLIKLYKLVLTSKSVDETLVCDNSNQSYKGIHVVLFIMLCKVVLTFKSVDEYLLCSAA